jgi:prepilin-type processing-associated H-X9-DG protein
MKKEVSLSLISFVVGVLTTVFIILVAIPALYSLRNVGSYNVCGTNLKGLGTAMIVYANDYDDNYPQLSGKGAWSKGLGFPYYLEKPDFNDTQSDTSRNITSSWYLLVKYADVSPKPFVCPYSPQSEFDGSNPYGKYLVELWDFGFDPYQHVSYAYHNPYGKFPPDGTRSAAFAVAADMSPWFNHGSFVLSGKQNQWSQIITASDESTLKLGNGQFHDGMGQNVLFADGHTSFEKQPNVGVNNDNIYTFWSTEDHPTEQDIQGGTAPTGRSPENDAKSEEDSFLAI